MNEFIPSYLIDDLTQIHNDISKHVKNNFADHIIIDEISAGFEMFERHQDTYFKCITPDGYMSNLHVTYYGRTHEIKTCFETGNDIEMYLNYWKNIFISN